RLATPRWTRPWPPWPRYATRPRRNSYRRSRRCTGPCRRPWPASTSSEASEAMARRIRLDSELVRRGLARSRAQAAELVTAGQVRVRGMVATKPATMVDPADPVVVEQRDAAEGGDQGYVSRGARKLAGALAEFTTLDVAGRRCLDAGASTGGRSVEHTSELQSREKLVCRLLLEKKIDKHTFKIL